MSINKINTALTGLQQLKSQAQGATVTSNSKGSMGFAEIFQQQLGKINMLHKQVDSLQERFALGEDVSIADVKVAELKASIYTQGLIHVRNELVKAYNEIMNMAI